MQLLIFPRDCFFAMRSFILPEAFLFAARFSLFAASVFFLARGIGLSCGEQFKSFFERGGLVFKIINLCFCSQRGNNEK